MYKKCKVVILAQKKLDNSIVLHTGGHPTRNTQVLTNYNLYILSDDEIKEGDWCIMLDSFNHVFSNPQQYLGEEKGHHLNKGLKKIIASTDSSLNKEPFIDWECRYKPIPYIPQSFIDKCVSEYNKGNKIEEVMVEYEGFDNLNSMNDSSILGIILNLNPDNTINIKSVKDSWTREEVISVINNVIEFVVLPSTNKGFKDLNKWIEDNL